MISLYSRCLKQWPLATNVISGTAVMTCGDCLAQIIQHRQVHHHDHGVAISGGVVIADDHNNAYDFELDRTRLAKMISWTIVAYVPINFYAFRIIERILPDVTVAAGSRSSFVSILRQSMPRIVAKAFLATSPAIFINPIFFMYSSTVEASIETARRSSSNGSGGDWRPDWKIVEASVVRRYQEDLIPVLSNAVQLWVPVNIFNFCFVPRHFRVVTVSVVATLWNTYLSLVTHKHNNTPN